MTHLKMTEKENVITYFTDLEKLRIRLLNRIDSAQRDAYEPCLWPTMVLHVRAGIHNSYIHILQSMCLFRAKDAATTTASDRVLNVEEDYKKVNYDEFKRACVRQYMDNQKLWEKGGNVIPSFAMNAGDVSAYDPNVHQTLPCSANPNGLIAGRGDCWSCRRNV